MWLTKWRENFGAIFKINRISPRKWDRWNRTILHAHKNSILTRHPQRHPVHVRGCARKLMGRANVSGVHSEVLKRVAAASETPNNRRDLELSCIQAVPVGWEAPPVECEAHGPLEVAVNDPIGKPSHLHRRLKHNLSLAWFCVRVQLSTNDSVNILSRWCKKAIELE